MVGNEPVKHLSLVRLVKSTFRVGTIRLRSCLGGAQGAGVNPARGSHEKPAVAGNPTLRGTFLVPLTAATSLALACSLREPACTGSQHQQEGSSVRLFDPRSREDSGRLAHVYAGFEILHTAVDFLAAGLFIVGSFLFFSESTMIAGTWCFVAGSVCFALKPTIRLIRELRLASLRHVDVLAEKAPEAPADVLTARRGPQRDVGQH